MLRLEFEGNSYNEEKEVLGGKNILIRNEFLKVGKQELGKVNGREIM